MKKYILITLLFLCEFENKAQVNLVPNYSFEDTISCPYSSAQIHYSSSWIDPNNGSSDYFNSCNNTSSGYVGIPVNMGGHQLALTGEAYSGLYVYFNNIGPWREYIQVQLNSQLQNGKNYYVEFFVSLADTVSVAATVSLYFSDTAISGTSAQLFNVIPQIINDDITNPLTSKTTWSKVSGTYNASGNENYITIGNFKDDNNTDTTQVSGGSYPGSYYYIDDVSVICLDCDTTAGIDELGNEMYFKLFPNPNDGTMNFSYSMKEGSSGELTLYDLAGKLIANYSLNSGDDNLLTIMETQLNAGIYFCKVMIDQQMELSEKIVIIK
jgi:hypothetical protein